MTKIILRAVPTRDRRNIILRKGDWRTSIPVEKLPGWIALYRRLRDRKAPTDKNGTITGPGPYHRFYADDLATLEALQQKLATSAQESSK